MAVQAQYPSNVLLLNRNTQDAAGLDSSLQQQPAGAGGGGQGGGFLQQHSHTLFNNGGNLNPTKRRREISAATGLMAPILNPFCFQQSHPQHLIDLSQLHNPQTNVVSTGLHLSSGDRNNLAGESPAFFSLLPDDLATQIKQQRDEIDQFLQTQEEQLRRTLAEKRQRHYRELLGAAEETAARRLREREAEVEKATRRNAELEARAARLSMEALTWQAKARAQEATAASLQAQLQQAIMRGSPAPEKMTGGTDGAGEGQPDDAESAHIDPERVAAARPRCKACRKRVASVVLLPCRHLCLCTDCDKAVENCPLCRALRNSSVEVYLS